MGDPPEERLPGPQAESLTWLLLSGGHRTPKGDAWSPLLLGGPSAPEGDAWSPLLPGGHRAPERDAWSPLLLGGNVLLRGTPGHP